LSKKITKAAEKIVKPSKENLKYVLFRKHRLMRLLGLRELALKVGISRQTLSDYERGLYPPTIEIFERLQKSLGLTGDIVEYFGRRPKATPQKKIPCCVKDCENKAYCKNMCRAHYERMLDKKNAAKQSAKN
jgi:transcriptional regulator with XRE-family HTH domain